MNFKNITLADVSTEAKVETLGIVLDKKIEELSSAVYSVAKEKGEQGDRGQKGDKGDKGDQGIPGKNGNDGINGINGKDGLNGKDGEDGEKAPKIVDAEIAIDDTLLLTLSDGSQIKTTKQVVGERGSNGSNGANGSKGDKGDPGETGAAGVGIASGGTTDQVLAKNSSTDYDTKWTTLGTMSTQDANAVAITGGTINGTTIGATTPSTVNATTITGQTARLNGTGSNLLLQSNNFTTTWTTTSATIATTVATTDPFGGSNAWIITNDATLARHQIQQTFTSVSGINYTFSCYGKNNNAGFLYLRWATSNKTVVFNLSTGAVGTTDSGITASITNAGNGWYRCIATYTTAVTSDILAVGLAESDSISTYSGTSKSIYLYGAQLEVSSTANTYIPTTTTAVYGTPTLFFSGVSEIGLLSNGALYLQPAGTGALQAQATTSTAAGGNARGANAVDWQTSRDNAAKVASGTFATIGGGDRNTASGFTSTVAGGRSNQASSSDSIVCGGNSNFASQNFAAAVGGKNNVSGGFYNFIGAGFTNSGTSATAVTTQSGTMNGTTAVTLSGSNASIRVGQYITGTSIAVDTYVAAISGTALTLSVAASGSSTSTLSFFAPHGVVVGGGNNQATGIYSFIGGGGDAGTAANRNVASGAYSVVVGGRNNQATGQASFIGCGGYVASIAGNTASGNLSAVVSGVLCTASAEGAFIGSGYINVANGLYSTIAGGVRGTTRSIVGNAVFPACSNPIADALGINQAALLVLAVQTTDATATALRSNSSAASGTNQVILPNNSAYFFRGEVVSGKTAGGDTKGWTIEGVIKRGANAAATTLVGVTVLSTHADAGAATWTIAVTADTTNGGLRVTFTGQAATTIRTVCQIRTTEMTF